MKKEFNRIIYFVLPLLVVAYGASAQMMMGGSGAIDDHTAREEAEGREVWEKLQAKQTDCANLTDENFGALGEYFMGLMMGDSHASMNQMMIRVMGEEGEEQVHVAMGKRLSGCDPEASLPGSGRGFMPMVNMMWGGKSASSDSDFFGGTMMNYGFMPFSWLGALAMILWWVVIIVLLVAFVRWLAPRSRGGREEEKSPTEILKERYARGEIDKKEFEEKKKDLAA